MDQTVIDILLTLNCDGQRQKACMCRWVAKPLSCVLTDDVRELSFFIGADSVLRKACRNRVKEQLLDWSVNATNLPSLVKKQLQ